MLEHGGRLLEAARRHGIEAARWLDLSTGINPHAYPVGTINAQAWRRLPEAATPSDIVMLCQPNNPTGEQLSKKSLHTMLTSLRRNSGMLIVDEAYMDATPGASLLRSLSAADWELVIVLRSVGKFFGLAGARAGFAMGSPTIMQRLNEELGPWSLTGPTRAAVAQALNDTAWQVSQRAALHSMAAKLDNLLHQRLNVQTTGTTLFRWFTHPRSAALYAHLASAAILIRQFAAPASGALPSLRFGLPVDDQQLARLDAALETFQ